MAPPPPVLHQRRCETRDAAAVGAGGAVGGDGCGTPPPRAAASPGGWKVTPGLVGGGQGCAWVRTGGRSHGACTRAQVCARRVPTRAGAGMCAPRLRVHGQGGSRVRTSSLLTLAEARAARTCTSAGAVACTRVCATHPRAGCVCSPPAAAWHTRVGLGMVCFAGAGWDTGRAEASAPGEERGWHTPTAAQMWHECV